MQHSTDWFKKYLPQLAAFGFKPNPAETSDDGFVTSFNSITANAAEVRRYFSLEGFVNTDHRTYMAHTGNPHVNLDKDGNTVQISWFPKRNGLTGVSFLSK